MAFCDNPRCRWHDVKGACVEYERPVQPMRVANSCNPDKSFGEYEKIVVNNHEFRDTITNGYHDPIQRFFCDECRELVFEAFNIIREVCEPDDPWGFKPHDPNLFIASVESAWIKREKKRKK